MAEITSSLQCPFNVYCEIRNELHAPFHVAGSIHHLKGFPTDFTVPRPGLWIYAQTDRHGVPDWVLCKVTSLTDRLCFQDVYQVSLSVNRLSLSENILFAR